MLDAFKFTQNKLSERAALNRAAFISNTHAAQTHLLLIQIKRIVMIVSWVYNNNVGIKYQNGYRKTALGVELEQKGLGVMSLYDLYLQLNLLLFSLMPVRWLKIAPNSSQKPLLLTAYDLFTVHTGTLLSIKTWALYLSMTYYCLLCADVDFFLIAHYHVIHYFHLYHRCWSFFL